MARQRQSIIEYRSYDLPVMLPLQVHQGMNWQISSVRSERLHIHNCFEIGICLSGSGTMCFGEEEKPFQAGDLLFVGRNIPHTTWSDPVNESVWKYIHIDPERLLGSSVIEKSASPGEFYRMITECHLLLSAKAAPWTTRFFSDLTEEATRKEPDYIACIHGLCETLFFRLFRIYCAVRNTGESPYLLTVLSPALEFIHTRYRDQFPMEELAAACHMSPTHFRRKFQQQIGTNPLSYLHQIRIMKSRDLLRSTNQPIAEIAEEVGYQSLSCFNRHFIELNQCTPSTWRNLRSETQKTTLVGLAGWERPETGDEIARRNQKDTSPEYED